MILPLLIIDEGENSKIQERASSGPGDVPSPSKISEGGGGAMGKSCASYDAYSGGPGVTKKKNLSVSIYI